MSLFQKLHHICIVVRDIEHSVRYYESLGVGPWQPFPSLKAFDADLVVPDRDAFLQLRYMFANVDNVQIQLCEPPEGNTPQRKFLIDHGEGVFHLGFSVDDCDSAEALGKDSGLGVLLHGRRQDRSGFTYFDTSARGAGVVLQVRSVPAPSK